MSTVTITRLADIHGWSGDIRSLVAACVELTPEEIDNIVGSAAVSSTLTSYLHFEAVTLPNYDTMSGVPRETAEAMRLVWKPLRNASNHRVLREQYTKLLGLYDQVPTTATGLAVRHLPLAKERPAVVRLIEFGVALHMRCYQLVTQDPRSEEWRNRSRGLRMNFRFIPVGLTADECYQRMHETMQALLAD